jgi:hypothetical protein
LLEAILCWTNIPHSRVWNHIGYAWVYSSTTDIVIAEVGVDCSAFRHFLSDEHKCHQKYNSPPHFSAAVAAELSANIP